MDEKGQYKLAMLIEAMSRAWVPHKGQAAAGRAVFSSDADLVYVECGRKFGKSEFAVYCCWMYALTRPGAEVYYLAPAVKQAKELVWANSRMQTCNTYDLAFQKEVERIFGEPIKYYHHEMRIVLPNGSFIKIDGSDNYNTQRGLKPDFIVADEYRDFKKEWIEAVRPNMSVKKGKILFITTPPHGPNHAYEMAEECKNGDDHYFYLNLPSNCNDRIPGHTEWLAREKERLYRLNRRNEWRREYMAEFITSDENAVIPQLNRDILIDHTALVSRLNNAPGKLELHVTMDPGNSSVFAGIVSVFDPHRCELYLMDCVHVKDSQQTNSSTVWSIMQEKIDDLRREVPQLGESDSIYINNRTPWFVRDLQEIVKIDAMMVPNTFRDNMHNISLLKDVCAAGKLKVSDRMKPLITEAELYQRSKTTLKITNDPQQLINCVRYALHACNYTIDMLSVPSTPPEDEKFLHDVENYVNVHDKIKEIAYEEFGIVPDEDVDDLLWDADFFVEHDNNIY